VFLFTATHGALSVHTASRACSQQAILLLAPLLEGRDQRRLGITHIGLSAEAFQTDSPDKGALLRLFSAAAV